MEELARGRTLDGRFELLERVTRGSLGEVWLVEDAELGERVVAKFLPRTASPEALELLKRQIRTLRNLHHPNIVPVYELHRTGDTAFVTVPVVIGEPLSSRRGRPLSELLPVLARVAATLEDAHRRGAVHGGLQLSNVLVDENGEPRLLDFGLTGESATSVARDVQAFVAMVEGLAREAPGPMPSELEDLLAATKRAGTLGELGAKLAGLSTRPSEDPPPERRIVLTPPPRLAPPSGEGKSVLVARTERGHRGGVGWLTIAAFFALIGLAVAVFVVLPSWVEERPPGSVAPAVADEPTPELTLQDLESLAPAKTEAERARSSALELARSLEARGAAEWNGAALSSALDEIDRGDELFAKRSYGDAAKAFESSREALEGVREDASRIAREAIRRGETELASGRSAAARESFGLALRIEPDNGAAKRGLRRAETLDEVLGLVAQGEQRERASDLKGAAELYRKAAALDPLSTAAASGLARVDARASEQAFRKAMSDGMRALESKDFPAARAAFEKAGAIRPGAAEVDRALAETEEAVRLETIGRRREAALALEAQEAWRKAEAEYRAVLGIDPTIRFAVDGAGRAASAAELHERIDFQLGHSERLSDAAALEEASKLYEEAASARQRGPVLERKLAALGELVRTYSTMVPVHFVSDNETDVTVYRVGRLGKFDRRALELRPGTYVVVGSREGYRDVRRELVVRADEPPEPLLVRCEERI